MHADLNNPRRPPEQTPASEPDGSPGEALKTLAQHLNELRAYVAYFVAARWDGVKLSLRQAGVYAALGIIGLLAAASLVVTGVVLLCLGLARGVAAALGGRQWAGDLIVGFGLLILLAASILIGLKLFKRSSNKRTKRKYEARRNEQRVEFGHDVQERAQGRANGH